MDNGIAAIIASGIASLVSLIVFIGSNIFTRINADKPYKIEIYKKQLFEVFAPLEILLDKSGPHVTPELLEEVKNIIYDKAKFTLIPNSLFQEYKKLTRPSDKVYTAFALHDIVSTYYNLRRKELGYPFRRNAINIWCLDSDEGLTILIKSLKNPFLITVFAFAASTVLNVLFVIVGNEWIPLIKYILGIGALIIFGIWCTDAPNFKRLGSQYKKAYENSAKKANIKQNISPPYQPVMIKAPANQNGNKASQK